MIRAQISGRMTFFGISDVVTTSVYLEKEKTSIKKMMMKMMMKMKIIFINIMTKSQETTVFYGRLKFTSAMKQRPEK